jgi:Domain of unknown function (DUF4340)
MSEVRRTMVFAGAALGLVALAWATAPRVREPGLFAERGEQFFPGFTDPNAAKSVELVEFNDQSGNVQPLKVINRNGIWTIPSHYDYPADAKDRLAQMAAAIIELRKDDVRSDTPTDHERCGVIDPEDVSRPGVRGRGTRVTIRGENERLLADIIIGLPAEGHDGYRYVRLPGQKRTYVSHVGEFQLSTAFADWIDRDLLQVKSEDIDGVFVRRYSLDERTGHVGNRETTMIRKRADGGWSVDGVGPGETVDTAGVNQLVASVVDLRIASVLPKPRGISATLGGSAGQVQISAAERDDLARKGFYVATDGELISNEGEVVVHTLTGVFYSLRFGEVAPVPPGVAAAIAAAKGEPSSGQPGENRYLFIMAGFDTNATSKAADATAGESRAASLRTRFAPWYYIISSDEFTKVRARRSDIVKAKVSSTAIQPSARH